MIRTFAGALLSLVALASAPALAREASPAGGQTGRGNQAPGPTVTVQGHTFTQQSLFQRNIGGRDDQTTAFPPHKIIGNIYYVGTVTLSSFLITTPQGLS